jgi:hypothetical protein
VKKRIFIKHCFFVINKRGGTLGFHNPLIEELDDMDDELPTPRAPPPSWIDLDIETDLDVLLSLCFQDIQTTLSTWAMITGPRNSSSASSTSSSHPLAESASPSSSTTTASTITTENESFQILPLLQTVTKMLGSVKNYTVHRHDLSDTAVGKLRYAALDLLESMKELENQHRVEDENNGLAVVEEGEEDAEGFLYRSSDFELLEKERRAIHKYLDVVEQYAFNPPHHIGGPPAMFTPEIQALLGKTSILSLIEKELLEEEQEQTKNKDLTIAATKKTNRIPEWLERGSFVNDVMGKFATRMAQKLNLDICQFVIIN